MYILKTVITWLFAIILFGSCQSPDEVLFSDFLKKNNGTIDIWIKNGDIIDGLNQSIKKKDILIQGDKIKYIGWVDTSKIEIKKVINAKGKVVTPGFIDTHAHGNPLKTPKFENFLAMGVTTICLGQDGSSPLTKDINTWMNKVDSIRPGVNIAMFVGHGTLRKLSGTNYKPIPDDSELEVMQNILRQSMNFGCFGMSTGLEYTPGIYAQPEELHALAKVVGSSSNGLIMSHVRNEDDDAIEASLDELIEQGQYCNVHVSHLKVVYGNGKSRAQEIISKLNKQPNSNYNITAEVYPYNASYTGIGILFPTWAKAPNNYQEVKKKRRAELLEFLRNKVTARNGPEATLFGSPPYAGLPLKEVSLQMNKPFEEVLLEDIGPTGMSAAYFVMDDSLQSEFIINPDIMICSDGSPTMHHPRGHGSFAKIIEEYVINRKSIPLELAIYKMTGLPAKTLGIKDRGVIAVGNKADILIFNPEEIRARATYLEPRLLAEGFEWIILNGEVAVSNIIISDQRNGQLLRNEDL